MNDTISNLGHHAQVYAHAEIKIFPLWGIVDGPNGLRCACRDAYECTSPGKHPLLRPAHDKNWILANGKCYGKCGQEGHGLYDATSDLDTITRWWTENPGANIGQPAHGNGYRILDVDPKSGGDESFEKLHTYVLDRTGFDLMDTLIQNTGAFQPGRRGMHLLYSGTGDGIPSKTKPFGADMPGLDTRGVGGYIVTWPSLHISGVKYEYLDWLHEPAPWPTILTDLLNPPKVAAKVQPIRQRGTTAGYAEAALDKELAIVRAAEVGTRNDTLNVAAFNLGQLVGGGQLSESTVQDELLSAATSIGLGTIEALKTINSGITSGMGAPRHAGRAA